MAAFDVKTLGGVMMLLWIARTGIAQTGPVPADLLERPLALRQGIGQAHERVTTSSGEAQAYYDQGLAYLHSYVWIEAARSFHQAIRLDPKLAMAYLGLSYALGELGEPEPARQASQQAVALRHGVTDRERVRIDLRTRQIAASAKPGDSSLRADYLKRFDQALAEHPKDVELLLLKGHGGAGMQDAPGMDSGSVSLSYYERALAEKPDYFAAHHYMTHALENIRREDIALQHAAAYARLAPQVPHAHHMYGHVLRHVGRMSAAIAEFRRADELEIAYFKVENIPPEYDWHYHHNLALLGASCWYVGQMAAAASALRRSFELPSIQLSQELNESAWPMFLLAGGRTEDALSASRALIGRSTPMVQALGHLMASRVLMSLHRMADAAAEGDLAIRQMRASDRLGGVLVPDVQLTQGELLLRSGQTEKAHAMLYEALTRIGADPGPEAWLHSLFAMEAASRLARDVGDWTLAAELAGQMRRYDDAYAGTRYAVARAAEHQGERAIARREYQAPFMSR